MQLTAEQEKLIDELGEIRRQLDLVKPLEVRDREIRNQIVSWCGKLNADDQIDLQGRLYTAQVGRRAVKHVIRNMPLLFRKLGQKIFLQHCEFPLGVAGQLLAREIAADIISEERSGPRPVRTIPRVAIGGKAAA